MASLADGRPQRARRIPAERWFFSGMALLFVLVVFGGFAPSYYLRGIIPDEITTYLDPPPQAIRSLFLLHGAAFSAWFLLQLLQSLLVAGKRLDLHRLFGQAALVLAPLIVILGLLVTLYTIRHGFHDTDRPPPILAAFPLFTLLWFSGFLIAGLSLRKSPAAHKRLMLLASASILGPATGRIVALPYPDWLPSWWDWAILFVVPLILWDLTTRRRLHAATLFGVAAFIAMFPLLTWVRSMPFWTDMVSTIAR
jgi:hypothetical protein